MPICIHCRLPLPTLYTTYSRADDSSLGKGVRLTLCPRCKRFADKYVEHDFVVLFIDLVLIKPEVYRHLLFNRLGGGGEGGVEAGSGAREKKAAVEGKEGWWGAWDPSILRLGILLLLFDVYLTWARIEKLSPNPTTSLLPSVNITATDAIASLTSSPPAVPGYAAEHVGFLASQSILNQYLFFLSLCTLQTVTFHGIVRFLCTRSWFYKDTRGLAREEPRSRQEGQAFSAYSRQGSQERDSRSTRPTSRLASARQSMDNLGVPPTSTLLPSNTIPSSIPLGAESATSTDSPRLTSSNYTAIPQLDNPATRPGNLTPTHSQSSTSTTSTNASASVLAPTPTKPTTISTALLVSSLPNLFPLLMVIWAYDLPSSASAVSWAVIVNNIAALEILLDCGVVRAASVVGLAGLGRWVVGGAVLGIVGLGGGEASGVLGMTAGIQEALGLG